MTEDVYSLSPLQEGIYYHWLSNPGSTVYTEQMCYRLKGKLDISLLEKSYEQLVSRHAVLRTFFTQEVGTNILQVVRKEPVYTFIFRDLGNPDESYVAEFKNNDYHAGFNLNKGTQARLSVLSLGNDTWEFIWTQHHILMDGWCVGIL